METVSNVGGLLENMPNSAELPCRLQPVNAKSVTKLKGKTIFCVTIFTVLHKVLVNKRHKCTLRP